MRWRVAGADRATASTRSRASRSGIDSRSWNAHATSRGWRRCRSTTSAGVTVCVRLAMSTSRRRRCGTPISLRSTTPIDTLVAELAERVGGALHDGPAIVQRAGHVLDQDMLGLKHFRGADHRRVELVLVVAVPGAVVEVAVALARRPAHQDVDVGVLLGQHAARRG